MIRLNSDPSMTKVHVDTVQAHRKTASPSHIKVPGADKMQNTLKGSLKSLESKLSSWKGCGD